MVEKTTMKIDMYKQLSYILGIVLASSCIPHAGLIQVIGVIVTNTVSNELE